MDSTLAAIKIFFMNMALYPQEQKKAQAEIDRVIGTDRLPNASDRPNLPYFEALFKETFRWEPIGSIGVPHMATEGDTYQGYHIPKGAIILPHITGVWHDPAVHKDPYTFNVDRFLGNNPEPSPFELTWGFGRRICPGRFLAEQNLWLEMVRTIAVFDIRAIKGQEPKVDFIPGVVNSPKPFKVDIKIRSAEHEALVRAVEVEHPLERGDARLL